MKALDIIKKFEGLRLTAYQDQGGVWTVGYGATGPDIKHGTVWTQEKADADLASRVAHLEEQLLKLVKKPMTDNQKAAFLSLCYNIGIGAFGSSTALREFNASNIAAAADAILKWNHIGKIENAGLTKRRHQEREIFLTA
jgi:lysozyme